MTRTRRAAGASVLIGRANLDLSRRFQDVWAHWKRSGQMGAGGGQSGTDWRSRVCPGVHLEVDWEGLERMGGQGAVSLRGWQDPLLDCRGGERGQD